MLLVYSNFYYPLDFTDFISGYLFNYFIRNWNLIHELLTVTPKSFLTANVPNEEMISQCKTAYFCQCILLYIESRKQLSYSSVKFHVKSLLSLPNYFKLPSLYNYSALI